MLNLNGFNKKFELIQILYWNQIQSVDLIMDSDNGQIPYQIQIRYNGIKPQP